MAKNSAPVAVRTAKPKTPAQIAKRERNIREATERLKRQQERTALLKKLRSDGFKGTDDQVIDQYIDQQRAIEVQQQTVEAETYVRNVLTTPVAGIVIQRWLKSRINMAPMHVKELIVKFLDRDGTGGDGHKDNSHLKAAVGQHLENLRMLTDAALAA